MLKYLRIAVTALSLTACVLLIALWVRSYTLVDKVQAPFGSGRVDVWSVDGVLCYYRFKYIMPTGWRFISVPVTEWHESDDSQPSWGLIDHQYNTLLFFPHWFPAVLIASIAGLLWLPWSGRFSLRTLLIATTLVAVGLGVVIYMAR